MFGRAVGVSLVLALTGCATTPAPERDAVRGPAFAPMAFFLGDTRGEGSLRIAMHRTRPVQVDGHSDLAPDGTLVLVQHVRQGHADRIRTWRIRPAGDARYTATLSDAVGPVAIEASGATLRIAYRAKGGLRIAQTLVLRPDGRTAANRLVVRKFGMRIATLSETIVRQ